MNVECEVYVNHKRHSWKLKVKATCTAAKYNGSKIKPFKLHIFHALMKPKFDY